MTRTPRSWAGRAPRARSQAAADEVLQQLGEPRVDALEAHAEPPRAGVRPDDAAVEGQRDGDAGERELARHRMTHGGQLAAQLERDPARGQVEGGAAAAAPVGRELDPARERSPRSALLLLPPSLSVHDEPLPRVG